MIIILPNFLVIGAEKSATTWLYNKLKQHPEIFMPETKEILYFNKLDSNLNERNLFNKKKLSWYKNFFSEVTDEIAVGEVSPMYICDPLAAKRIKKTIDNIKIIAILRNPIDRAYSHYWMAKSKGDTYLDFKEIVQKKERKFIKRGLYYRQLVEYYQLFDKNKIKIVLFSEMLNNKEKELKNIYDFLEINTNFIPRKINDQDNSSSAYRSKEFIHWLRKVNDLLRIKLNMGYLVDLIKKLGLADFLKNINKKKV